jgi:hypothetical protein
MTTRNEDSPLMAERSVPVSGFSRELRGEEDVERFWFSWASRGEPSMPVHIVFSASLRAAEVKMGDMKAVRFSEVASAEEARERWIAWRQGGRGRPLFVGPRRTGRHPVVRLSGL